VKQDAGEAIIKEQVPPGYHEAIRQYFGKMGKESEDGGK